mgnify:CR=1 FL=1
MLGPRSQESDEKGHQEDEATFTWDEANILI